MNSAEFSAYRSNMCAAIRSVLASAPAGSLDEAAFPAYSHPNPVINWLFWQRLHRVMDYLESGAPYEHVLDFGCGSGVMLPFLGKISKQVVAMDIDLNPFEQMRIYINFPPNLEIHEARMFSLDRLPAASFDIITALDVLEHVEDLPATLTGLLQLLKPAGRIIVSGPTENIFYRVGRRVAGPEYSGGYHKRGIAEIKSKLALSARLEQIAMLYWPAPLFDLFAALV